MNLFRLIIAASLVLVFPTFAVDKAWMTRAELSGYTETARFQETTNFCYRLAAASPLVKVRLMGRSPEERDIPYVIVTQDPSFVPNWTRASSKEVILVVAGIHAGEIEGKDAGLEFIRDMVIEHKNTNLLDHAVLVFVPIFNVDGHERFGPYNRINQNGPREVGWRTTSQNLNLNCDFLKADAPEMTGFLDFYARLLPELTLDIHSSDGADYQYDLTYGLEMGPNMHPKIRAWQEEAFLKTIFPALEKSGHLIAPYVTLINGLNPLEGIRTSVTPPRFSTGYGAIQNRSVLLVETHMLKPYQQRVHAVYDVIKESMAYVNSRPLRLRAVESQADSELVAQMQTYDPKRAYPVAFTNLATSVPLEFKGFTYDLVPSEISGTNWIQYHSKEPKTMVIPWFNASAPSRTVVPPLGYVIPAEWTAVLERLRAHKIIHAGQAINAPMTRKVESYRISNVVFDPQSSEGHEKIKDFTIEKFERTRTYSRGSVVIPVNTRNANVILHLLEPEAPDSLFQWGFFNSVLEQKEYGEGYVLEKMARDMMAKDPKLREQFDARLKSDTNFAANATARLDFFYQHSPYYDQSMDIYPIDRVVTPLEHVQTVVERSVSTNRLAGSTNNRVIISSQRSVTNAQVRILPLSTNRSAVLTNSVAAPPKP